MFKLDWSKDWYQYHVVSLLGTLYMVRRGLHPSEPRQSPLMIIEQETIGLDGVSYS